VIYFQSDNITIRDMKQEDSEILHNETLAQGCHSEIGLYEKYYSEQEQHIRYVFVAEYNGNIAGYTTMLPHATKGPFAEQGLPEIVDFNVLAKYRRRGIGTKILDVAESMAAKLDTRVSLGVGLHHGYGAAQRMYVKRGYIPDGSGVWYRDKCLEQYTNCCNDDDLVLYLSKEL